MTADERLALVLAKVDRANKHVADLRTALVAYKNSKPSRVVTRRDPATRRLEYVLESFARPPDELAAVVGDVLQNLRAALDHVAYQLVLVGTGKDASEERIFFPVATDRAHFGKLIASGQVQGARPAAVAAIEAVQPYNAGTDALTRLHRLNIIDKHRALLIVGGGYQAVDIRPVLRRSLSAAAEAMLGPDSGGVAFPSLWLRPDDTLFPMEAGAVLFVDEPDAQPDQKIQFLFDVELGEPAVVGAHQPLLATVEPIAVEVERVIRTFLPFLA